MLLIPRKRYHLFSSPLLLTPNFDTFIPQFIGDMLHSSPPNLNCPSLLLKLSESLRSKSAPRRYSITARSWRRVSVSRGGVNRGGNIILSDCSDECVSSVVRQHGKIDAVHLLGVRSGSIIRGSEKLITNTRHTITAGSQDTHFSPDTQGWRHGILCTSALLASGTQRHAVSPR